MILSDEVSCALFELDESYIKESAPKEDTPPSASNNTSSVAQSRRRVDVAVGIDILSILEISEVDGFLSLQINLKLSW